MEFRLAYPCTAGIRFANRVLHHAKLKLQWRRSTSECTLVMEKAIKEALKTTSVFAFDISNFHVHSKAHFLMRHLNFFRCNLRRKYVCNNEMGETWRAREEEKTMFASRNFLKKHLEVKSTQKICSATTKNYPEMMTMTMSRGNILM